MEQSGSYARAAAQSAAEERQYVVAQATGILMEKFTLGSDDAFAKLAAEAAESARSVVALAREIVAEVGPLHSDQVIEGANKA